MEEVQEDLVLVLQSHRHDSQQRLVSEARHGVRMLPKKAPHQPLVARIKQKEGRSGTRRLLPLPPASRHYDAAPASALEEGHSFRSISMITRRRKTETHPSLQASLTPWVLRMLTSF